MKNCLSTLSWVVGRDMRAAANTPSIASSDEYRLVDGGRISQMHASILREPSPCLCSLCLIYTSTQGGLRRAPPHTPPHVLGFGSCLFGVLCVDMTLLSCSWKGFCWGYLTVAFSLASVKSSCGLSPP